MRKRFLKFIVLLTFIAIFLFAGCTCGSCGCSSCSCTSCGTDYSYNEQFGAKNSGCGCGATTFSAPRGTQEALQGRFVKGDFFLTCHKDGSGYVKSFTYSIEVEGFSSDLAYSGCTVTAIVKYSVIGYNGGASTHSTSGEVVLNARGAGRKDVTINIECYDLQVVDVEYKYDGTVTYL